MQLIQLVFQGEAGRDGLGVHGPPGPPGPPGAIINLQEVSSDIDSPAKNGGPETSRSDSIILTSFLFSFSFSSMTQQEP